MRDLPPGYTADEVRAAERPLLAAGVPLMRRAAAGLAQVVREELTARSATPGRVLALVGSGDNGGDALFACALLAAAGVTVDAALLGTRVHDAGSTAAREAGVHVLERGAVPEAVAERARGADLVLDGLLGIGASGPLRPPARDVVAALIPLLAVEGAAVVVAVDLPSGVSADDGSAPGPVLPAATTVTFGAVKRGLLTGDGARLAGRIRLIDIGLDLPVVVPHPPPDEPAPRPRDLHVRPGTAQGTMGR